MIMTYTSMFEPLLIICLSTCLGFLIGSIVTIYLTSKEIKMLQDELDVFRDLYFKEIEKFKNKYVDDDYEAY